MDLSERAKIKQEIVKGTGYKTTIFEEYKYNDSKKEKYMYGHYRILGNIK